MKEQSTKDKLKAIAEWLYTNKEIILQEQYSVQYAILCPDDDGGATSFGVYAINEDNMWHLMYDVIKEFYNDNDEYGSFDEYMQELHDQFLEWDCIETDDDFVEYIPDNADAEGLMDSVDTENDE